eukprot:1194049-Prorocentrum_minimum.AAC.1
MLAVDWTVAAAVVAAPPALVTKSEALSAAELAKALAEEATVTPADLNVNEAGGGQWGGGGGQRGQQWRPQT